MNSNNTPHPLFASSSGQKPQNDDIDFNEVFAEYFSNEFDNDPINAYTSSMANFSTRGGGSTVATAPIAAAPVDPTPVALPVAPIGPLPTGGIKTTFHAASEANRALKKPRTSPGMEGLQQQQNPQVALPVGVGIRLGGRGGIVPGMNMVAQPPMWGQPPPAQGAANEQVVAERRQRNREHAKRSRVRKKFMLESLQAEVLQLQKLNQNLRMIVQEHIPEKSMEILADCSRGNPLFDDDNTLPAPIMATTEDSDGRPSQSLERQDFNLVRSLTTGQKCFVLSDPKLPDNPIVFATQGFYDLTGYTSKEVLGRNCRFLQGPGTDKKAIDVIRTAVATGADATVCLLNYKADGTPFWNQFFIAALRDSDNCIVNYVGVQTEVEPNSGSSALEDKVNAVMPLQMKNDRTG